MLDSTEGQTYITSICYPLQACFQKYLGYSPAMVGENLEVVIGYLRQLVILERRHFCFLLGWDIHTSSFGLPQVRLSFFSIPSSPCCFHQAFDPLVSKCYHIPKSCHRHVQEYNPSAVLHPYLLLWYSVSPSTTCFLSHVVDGGNIMALLRRIVSCRH